MFNLIFIHTLSILLMFIVSLNVVAACFNYIDKTTPTADFTTATGGIVVHNKTNLMWK